VRRALFGIITLGALVLSGEAAAQDKNACIRALDHAQQLQGDLKLSSARAEYVTCTSTSCPAAIREDCARLLVEVDGAMPTVVLAAVDASGTDIADARAAIDGGPLAALDGRATSLDPGSHVVRFERAGEAPVTVNVLARQGEKNRRVAATFPGSTKPAPKPKDEEHGERAPAPIVPIIIAGVSVIALGSALAMRLSIDSDVDDLRGSCAPSCAAAERDGLSSRLVVANVTFGVGIGALVAAAASWILTARR